ncbi:MAG: flavin reductase [Planctomycetota bacterium]
MRRVHPPPKSRAELLHRTIRSRDRHHPLKTRPGGPSGPSPKIESPIRTVAFRRGSATSPLVYDSRRFALCPVPKTARLLRATFETGHGLGEDPFLGIRTILTPGGCPIPASAPGWLECALAFNIDLEAECGLYVGRVRAGKAPAAA